MVRDDTSALAMLPVGPDGRRVVDDPIGNKRLKLDLEACAALGDGRLVVFGSGSKAARETLVLFDERARLTVTLKDLDRAALFTQVLEPERGLALGRGR